MLLKEILLELKSLSNPEIKAFKAKKYGIDCDNSWGLYQKNLSALAKKIGKNTALGIQLFETGNYDAQLLCAKICISNEISENLMDKWITFFNLAIP